MGPRRTPEPAWRFWANELLFFGAGMALGWFYHQWQRRRLGPDALAALTPEERGRPESSDDLP